MSLGPEGRGRSLVLRKATGIVLRAVAGALLALVVGGSGAPPPPIVARLVAAGSEAPSVASALALGRTLVSDLPPEALAAALAERPREQVAALRVLGQALVGAPPAERQVLTAYLAAAARASAARLAAVGQPWEAAELASPLTFLLLDPPRFTEDAELRARVLPVMRDGVDPTLPRRLRAELLHHLNQVSGLGFPEAEEIALAWGLAVRASEGRHAPFEEGRLRLADDLSAPLAASLYVLPSSLVTSSEAGAFLVALRRLAPERALLVLVDAPQREALEALAKALEITLLESHGRPFSPWPRDPMTWARRGDGAVVALVRPDLQQGREEDAHLGAALVQSLPPELDDRWGGVTWTVAPTPFHNGQLLVTRDALWLSIHSLEPRILSLLEVPRVPVERFTEAAALDAYLGAAETAASELAALYRLPVRFLHPLPRRGALEERTALMHRLGGGAGHDLDSWLTLLPGSDGDLVALVGDLSLGGELLESFSATDWRSFAERYRTTLPLSELGRRLPAAQHGLRGSALQSFLDLVASELETAGLEVLRLPLMRLPRELVPAVKPPEVLLGWNNVVVESAPDGARAEGFATGVPGADRRAVVAYAAAGFRLELVPPLVESVLRGGGYRCASNHLRGEEASVSRSGAETAAWCNRSLRSAGSSR